MERYLGQLLSGRYQINEIIGVGGMAVVYKAYDTVLARDVALKILKTQYRNDAEFCRRFSNESKAITLLTHDNIVDIYDVKLDGDDMYIVMEYLDGVTLKEYIDTVGLVDWREGTHYVKQMLSALKHAHERGIVHRDLKPQNIMLLRNGTIKVMDFGIARIADFETQTMSEKTIGSVHYISPEQASGDAVDERTDIYAIGIILYQLCTGALPFDGDNAVSVALMQIQDQPILPRELNSGIPAGLEQIILRAMMKNPLDRYAEASDMLTDIEKIEDNAGYCFSSEEYITPFEAEQAPVPEEEKELAENEDSEELESLTPTEKKKLSTKLPIIGGFLSAVVFFIGIAAMMLFWPDIFAEKKYEVPNLIDKMFEEVVDAEEYSHFEIVKKGEKASEKEKGTILTQSIAEFTMVKDGTKIEVYVSSGVETACVPDVIGMPLAKAKEVFNDYEIPFKCVEVYSDSMEEGLVVRTSIEAGDEVNLSTDFVIIYVSLGPRESRVSVPNLIGKTSSEAKSSLSSVGLVMSDNIVEEYSDTVEKGKVIRQSPSSGSSVSRGSTVKIFISKGKDPSKQEEKTGSIALTVNFDASYTEQAMRIVIKQGTTILSAQTVTYESLSDGVFAWSGTADINSTVTVMVDDALQKSMVVTSGLNTITVNMSSGAYVEGSDDSDDPDNSDNPDHPDDSDNPDTPDTPVVNPENPDNSTTTDNSQTLAGDGTTVPQA